MLRACSRKFESCRSPSCALWEKGGIADTGGYPFNQTETLGARTIRSGKGEGQRVRERVQLVWAENVLVAQKKDVISGRSKDGNVDERQGPALM